MSSLEAILELKEKLNTLDVEILDKITIGDFPNTGRGVKANETIYKGTTLMVIGHSCVGSGHCRTCSFRPSLVNEFCLLRGASFKINPTDPKKVNTRFILDFFPEIYYFIANCSPMVQVDSFDIVAMWLVKEKLRENSRFNGYFASLPDEFSTPLCTPRRDWILLPKQVQKTLDLDQEDLETRFQRLLFIQKNSASPIEEFRNILWTKYRWACAAIRSRWASCYDHSLYENPPSFLKVGSDHDRGTLIPWFDMMNHGINEDYNAKYFYNSEKGVVVKAVEDIEEGSEVLISYHDRPDDDLLMDYGFVLPVGENEESCLDFPIQGVEKEAKKFLRLTPKILGPVRKELNLNIRISNEEEKYFFKIYADGVAPELENYIRFAMKAKSPKNTETEDLTDLIEVIKFIQHLLNQRISELNNLDLLPRSENNPDKNPQHALYAQLRQIHRHIAQTSITAFDAKIKDIFKQKKILRKQEKIDENGNYFTVDLL